MVMVLIIGSSVSVFAAPVEKENPFVCPSVSLNNPNGMWALSGNGAYYILIPTKGGANDNSKIYINIPEKALDQAQVAAGKSLYKKYFSYPNFVSGPDMNIIGLLEEGLNSMFQKRHNVYLPLGRHKPSYSVKPKM